MACGRIFSISILSALALAGCAKRYRVEGVVLRVEPAALRMVVSHKAITGLMPAMAMPFRVREESELRGLAPGSRITFDLRVAKHQSEARRVRLVQSNVIEEGGRRIPLEPPKEKVVIGAPVPDFALNDHRGGVTRLSDFRGRVVAVNFIYTRCPLPEVCPRLSAHFARLQRRFGGAVTLLSITIDPTYDTPEVLARYAKNWRAGGEHWRFLTGDTGNIRRIAGYFGLVYWPEEGLITHTSSTGVIGRDGRLQAIVEGSSWEADQLGDLIQAQLGDQ